nr:hypothetical protein [Roseofilum sp. SBFL]
MQNSVTLKTLTRTFGLSPFELSILLSCAGQATNRDINASKNILAAGLAVSVCGASVRPDLSKSVKATAMKQKPKL